MDTLSKKMTKAELTSIVMFQYSHRPLADLNWEMTDEEVDAINKNQRELSAGGGERGESSHAEIIDAYWRMDDKTNRLIQSGFVVFEDVAVFANEQDALDFINSDGYNFTSFADAAEASENGEFGDCYETDWLS